MTGFVVALTIFAAPLNIEANAALTLQPQQVITFNNTTEKNTTADCVRVQKALTTSRMIAYCSDPVPATEPAPTVEPASAKAQ